MSGVSRGNDAIDTFLMILEEKMEIPYKQLSKEALRNLITEFVSSSDDYGYSSLESKIEHVMKQLADGTILISFCEESESCFLCTRDDYKRKMRSTIS
mgnify:FL=1